MKQTDSDDTHYVFDEGEISSAGYTHCCMTIDLLAQFCKAKKDWQYLDMEMDVNQIIDTLLWVKENYFVAEKSKDIFKWLAISYKRLGELNLGLWI